MKKIALISALVLMLLACSVSDVSNIMSPLFTPTALPSATYTLYVTPSDTPTITPTLPTPTFTETPTLMGSGFTATPSLTESPTSAFTSTVPVGVGNSITTPEYVGFSSVQISGNILRWGGCEPSSVTFTAQVVDPINETAVLLFLRLKNPSSGEMTKMGAGAIMNGNSTGTFTYTVTAKNISHYQDFPSAWVQYQLVATNGSLERLGWTQVYQNSLTISPCG
jgi:hypothetical protein